MSKLKKTTISIITVLALISLYKTETEFNNQEIVDASEGSEYEEEPDQEILTNVKNLDQTLAIFPIVFLYITKDNCEYCRSLDPVYEEVFRVIQKDQTCEYISFCI
jgi:thiol-disulfide isomerase/thioredoxin